MRILCAGATLSFGVAPAEAQSFALGLHLPKEAMAFYGFSDGRAWGLEAILDLQKRSSDAEEELPSWSRYGALGVVYQRALGAGAEVAPFGFVRAASAFEAESFTGAGEFRELSGELAVGAGVSWRPRDRVALWARQGLSLARVWTEDDPREVKDAETLNANVLRFRLEAPEVLAVFMW